MVTQNPCKGLLGGLLSFPSVNFDATGWDNGEEKRVQAQEAMDSYLTQELELWSGSTDVNPEIGCEVPEFMDLLSEMRQRM